MAQLVKNGWLVDSGPPQATPDGKSVAFQLTADAEKSICSGVDRQACLPLLRLRGAVLRKFDFKVEARPAQVEIF